MIAVQRWLEHGTVGRELLKSGDLDLAAFQQSSHAVNLLSVPQCLHLESRITRLHPGFVEPSSELEYLVTHVADKLLAKRSRMPQLFSRVQFMLNESGKQASELVAWGRPRWNPGVRPLSSSSRFQDCSRASLHLTPYKGSHRQAFCMEPMDTVNI